MNDLNSIVAAHRDAVWRTAFRLLNNREDALDCFQETFLAASRLADSSEVRHWRTLLVRIATRRAIDQLRRRYAQRSAQANCDLADPRAHLAPANVVEGHELRELVRQALARLPADQAEAFWLRYLEDWSGPEVAEALAITPGHVRVLVHRAAAALREQLGDIYGPPSRSKDTL